MRRFILLALLCAACGKPRNLLRQDASKEEEEYFGWRCSAWGHRVHDILKDKYGEPLPAGSYMGTKWRTAETIVGLSSADDPILAYEDAAKSEEVKAAEDAYQRADKAARDEESRRRF